MSFIRNLLWAAFLPVLLFSQNLPDKIFSFWEAAVNDSAATDSVLTEAVAGMKEYLLLFPASKNEDELLLDLAEVYGRLNRPVPQWNALLKLVMLHGNSPAAAPARAMLDSINNYTINARLAIRHVAALNQALRQVPEADYRHAFINYLNLLVTLDIPRVNALAIEQCNLYLRMYINEPADVALVLFWKGLFEKRAGRRTAALLSFKLLQKLFPEADVVANSYYHMALLSQKTPRLAQNYLVELINQFPDHPLSAKAQFLFADIYYGNGSLDDALANFKLLLEVFPQSDLCPDALLRIAEIYERQARYDDARQALKQALLYNSGEEKIKKILERLIILEKDKAKNPQGLVEARIEFAGRFVNDPRSPAYLLAAARESLEYLKDRRKALQLLKRLIDAYPAGSEAAKAMKLEKELKAE